MKKILFSLGSAAIAVAPFAALVSCGNDKVSAPFKETARTDDEIANEILLATNSTMAISHSPSIEYFDDGTGSNALTVETVKKYWNKPEGETLRLVAITNAIGEKIWGHASVGMPSAADTVIRAIVFGVKYNMIASGQINSGSSDDEAKKLASNQLNDYKVELIKNIESTISKFDVTSSLQKFDGFINWFIDPSGNYQNLKETLIAGKITKNVIQGIQDELNKPTDALITGGKTDIVIIEPTV